jgi:3-hydroxyacyl-CoA dehydrogenase
VRPIGVAGAGTMGAGIAALAAEASLHTLLYDPDPEALARAPEASSRCAT